MKILSLPGVILGHPGSSWRHPGVILGHHGVILNHTGVPSEGLKYAGHKKSCLGGWWVGGGTVILTYAPGPGLCYVFFLDLQRSLEIFRD